jgi:hypothetical protein
MTEPVIIHADQLQIRTTETEWNSVDYIPRPGQICFALDTNHLKIGDGIQLWKDLEFPNRDEIITAFIRIIGLENNIILKADKTYVDNRFIEYTKTIDMPIFIESSIANTYVKLTNFPTLTTQIISLNTIDNLSSVYIDKPLSANQGRVLNTIKANRTELPNILAGSDIQVDISGVDVVITNTAPNIDPIVIDNLLSISSTEVLSANQGRILNNKIDTKLAIVDLPSIIDNLTSTSVNNPLSAKQGKILKDDLDLKLYSVDSPNLIGSNNILVSKNGSDNTISLINVTDNLLSNSNINPLSANQGRILDLNKANVEDIPIVQAGLNISVAFDAINRIYTITNASPNIPTTIVDNLGSTSITSALSANQGKVLDNTKLNISDLPNIINNLTSTSINNPLSANQGRILETKKLNIVDLPPIIDDLITTDIDKPLSANQGRILEQNKADRTELPMILDVINSSATSAALSANQGRLLNNKIDNLITTLQGLGIII